MLLMAAPSKSAEEDSRFIGLDSTGARVPPGTDATAWACVQDQRTGLTWEARTADGGVHDFRHTYTWRNTSSAGSVAQCSDADSNTKCDSDRYIVAMNRAGWCGIADWRLPNREELRSLVEYDRRYPSPTIDLAHFPHTAAQFYWAAEPDADDAAAAWGIGFVHGFDYTYPRNSAAHLRLVHGHPHPSGDHRFIAQSDGTLHDTQTGLTWQRCAAGQSFVDQHCVGKARALNWGAANDSQWIDAGWRLPTVAELASIVDLSRTHPAIGVDAFPDTPSADFWTSTPFFDDTALHWLVNFTYGDTHVSERDGTAFVRVVRDGPPDRDVGW